MPPCLRWLRCPNRLLITAKALCECAAAVVKRRGLPAGSTVGYEEIAEEAFGSFGKALVSAIIYVELFGTCALLYILEVGPRGC